MQPKLTAADLREITTETRYTENSEAIVNAYFEDAATLLKHAQLETSFLLQDVLPRAAIVFLAGQPETGKSWLAYDLAFAVARGRPWLIYRNALGTPRPVLVLNYDNPEAEIGRRFLRMGLKPSDPILFHSIAREKPPEGLPASLKLPESLEGLLRVISHVKPALILLDSLRQAHTMDELSSAHMGLIASCLRNLTAPCGSTVLAIHHKRKRQNRDGKAEPELTVDDEAMRGSGELHASADAIMHAGLFKKLLSEVTGTLFVTKTRGWVPKMAQCDYKIRDEGAATIVEPGGRLDNVLAAIKKHEPISRRELVRKVHGLEPRKLAELVNLCIEFGRVKEVARSGETRVLVLVKPDDTGHKSVRGQGRGWKGGGRSTARQAVDQNPIRKESE